MVSYPDLEATVHRDSVPPDALEEIPSLYSSVFSTVDWWETHDHMSPTGVCVLEHPRHVLAFCAADDTAEVLNKVFAISAADARRACSAIFRALPHVRRIRMEVLFPPRELRLPLRVRATGQHMVIDLPATVDEYHSSLGRRTRGNLRNFQNRLRRDHPDLVTEVTIPGEAADDLFEQFLAWKTEWFHSRGRTTFWETSPYQIDQFKGLARRRAEAHITRVDGAPIAIRFMFPAGVSTVSLQGSFDPAYQEYRLGMLTSYWTIVDAIERGMEQVNMLWGTPDYKGHLGATPRPATQISVFRSQTSRLYSLGEAREIATRHLRERRDRLYWRSRRRAGKVLERVGLRRVRETPGS